MCFTLLCLHHHLGAHPALFLIVPGKALSEQKKQIGSSSITCHPEGITTISAGDMAEIQIRMEEAAVEPFLRSIISRLKSSYIRRNVIGALALGLVVGICAGGCMGAMAAEMANLLKDIRINETELRMKISNYTHHPVLSTAQVTYVCLLVAISSSATGLLCGHQAYNLVKRQRRGDSSGKALALAAPVAVLGVAVSCGADLFYYFVTGGAGKVGTGAVAATAGVLAVLSNVSSMLGTGASLGVLLAASESFSYNESSLLPSKTTAEEGKTLLRIKFDATRRGLFSQGILNFLAGMAEIQIQLTEPAVPPLTTSNISRVRSTCICNKFGALGLGLVAGGCMGAMSAEMPCFLKDATQSQTELIMNISELYPFITSSYVTYMSLLEFIFFLDLGSMLPLILPSLLLCLSHKFHLSKKAVAIPSIMITTVLIARSYFHDKDQPVPSLDPAEFTIPALLVMERFFVLVLGIQMFQASWGAVLFSYFVTEGAGDVCTGAVAATFGVLTFLLKTSNILGTGASLGGLLAASGGAGVALNAAGDLGHRYGGLAGRAGAVIGGAVGAFLALATQNLKFGIMVSLCAAAIPGFVFVEDHRMLLGQLAQQQTCPAIIASFGIMDNGRRFSVVDPTPSSRERRDVWFHSIISSITQHSFFNAFIMIVVIINAFIIALEEEYSYPGLFWVAEEVFLLLYVLEFVMKMYVDPRGFWRSAFNIFNSALLLLSLVAVFTEGAASFFSWQNFRPFRALRVLKIISFFPSLQALAVMLAKAMKRALYVMSLVFFIMFIFAVAGVLYFGEQATGDVEHWGDLSSALLTIFGLITLDSWVDLLRKVDGLGVAYSRLFPVIFILVGHFIFFNMFIGLVIMEVERMTKAREKESLDEREAAQKRKKPKKTMKRLIGGQISKLKKWSDTNIKTDENFPRLIQQLRMSLSDSEYVITKDKSSSLTFLQMYLTTLRHQDTTLDKLQEIYGEMIEVLSELELQEEEPREENEHERDAE
ncbi:hypothetical protein AOLI_G00170930 [Acnodon oligacanthus]